MAANPNLLGNVGDAALRRGDETADESAGMLPESGRNEMGNEVANKVANEMARAVSPRATAAVPETRRAEQAALLRPKIMATPLHGQHGRGPQIFNPN